MSKTKEERYNHEVIQLMSKTISDLKKLSARYDTDPFILMYTFGDSMMKLAEKQQSEYVKKLHIMEEIYKENERIQEEIKNGQSEQNNDN